MAEMNPSNNNSKNGKRKKSSLRVDLTPMVDLGFLLITFFIFTATLAQKTVMPLFMPTDKGDDTPIPQSGAITILPDAKGIGYYEGFTPTTASGIRWFSYADKELLRSRLLQVKKGLIQQNGNDDKMMVVIKPTPQSNFKQVTAMLDEMLICDIKRYAMVEISPEEKEQLAQK